MALRFGGCDVARLRRKRPEVLQRIGANKMQNNDSKTKAFACGEAGRKVALAQTTLSIAGGGIIPDGEEPISLYEEGFIIGQSYSPELIKSFLAGVGSGLMASALADFESAQGCLPV
jgi:hypothetical protein